MRQVSRIHASAYPFYDIPGPVAIVHRGGDAAGADKENTLAAFDSAYRQGIIYGETDVVATSDGVVLAFHGSANKREARRSGLMPRAAIQRMTYADVQREVRIGGEPMPRLEEVLVSFPKMRFFIDPKTPESVAPLAIVLKKLGVYDRVSIGGFSYQRTRAVVQALNMSQEELCTCAAILGSIAFAGLGFSFTSRFSRPYLNRSQITSVQVPHNWVTPNMVARGHALGIKVIVWPWRPVLNDTPAYMDRALGQGVYGLMSDHTASLRSAVLAYDPHNQSIKPVRL